MLENKSNIPNVVSYLALNLSRGSLQKKCGHDVLACSPLKAMKWIKTPTFFIIGKKDELVNLEDFRILVKNCTAYPKKFIEEEDAGHPDCREEETIDEVFKFFEKTSKISKKKNIQKKENFKKLLKDSEMLNNDSDKKISEDKIEKNKKI